MQGGLDEGMIREKNKGLGRIGGMKVQGKEVLQKIRLEKVRNIEKGRTQRKDASGRKGRRKEEKMTEGKII